MDNAKAGEVISPIGSLYNYWVIWLICYKGALYFEENLVTHD